MISKGANKGILLATLFFFYVLLFVIAIKLGDRNIALLEIFKIFIGIGESDLDSAIIIDIRLPRILMAIIVGALLASSGVVVQSVFANPLADPYIIGIASAATFGAVSAYLLNLSDSMYGILGFLCCVAFSIILFKISRKSNIQTLLIIGIALSSFLGAFTSFFIYFIGEDSFRIVAWLMGYLGLASWEKILMLFAPLSLCLIYFFIKRHELNILLSGDEEAKSLGISTNNLKRNLLITSSLAVAFSVAFTGLIAFVGLIIPHMIRMIVKSSNASLLIPLSTLFGGWFLLFCDTIARSILAPIEIPIGIITSFFGAPFFLYLAFKNKQI